MPTITIRNLEEQVKQRLRVLATEHGRSMEAEARDILTRETLARNQKRSGDVSTRPVPVRRSGEHGKGA